MPKVYIICKMSVDYHVKIIMLGNSGVGKTSLLLRFNQGVFIEGQDCTLGVFRYPKTVVLNDKTIQLEFWDTAGQERYYRTADGVLLVYDTTRYLTFLELTSWLSQIRELNNEATVVIAGNKSDLVKQNRVSGTTVENFARNEGLEYSETSAKDNENVDEVFEKLILKILEKKSIPPSPEESSEEPSDCADETPVNSAERSTNMVSASVQTEAPIRLDDHPRATETQKQCSC
ncbi:ras-related protein Rab-1B-like isoform X2 [Argiope bruennichi]|uniref:ras-related protein Rab-1B-like isoform X2 n=1 Tax=Argiope bruennichi TaxID=94029 RepID=UPI00249519B9|nr:ras-related protein Rab-1B-like isoform X2 [Argiope bruennichi]